MQWNQASLDKHSGSSGREDSADVEGGITEIFLVGMDRVRNLSMRAMLRVPYSTLQILGKSLVVHMMLLTTHVGGTAR